MRIDLETWRVPWLIMAMIKLPIIYWALCMCQIISVTALQNVDNFLRMRKLKQNLRWYTAETGFKARSLHYSKRQNHRFAESLTTEKEKLGQNPLDEERLLLSHKWRRPGFFAVQSHWDCCVLNCIWCCSKVRHPEDKTHQSALALAELFVW